VVTRAGGRQSVGHQPRAWTWCRCTRIHPGGQSGRRSWPRADPGRLLPGAWGGNPLSWCSTTPDLDAAVQKKTRAVSARYQRRAGLHRGDQGVRAAASYPPGFGDVVRGGWSTLALADPRTLRPTSSLIPHKTPRRPRPTGTLVRLPGGGHPCTGGPGRPRPLTGVLFTTTLCLCRVVGEK